MMWEVTEAKTDDEWFEDYVKLALQERAPGLPPKHQVLGAAEATWFETEPGLAFIHTYGGSVVDRTLAEMVVRGQLYAQGIKQARFSFPSPFTKLATWDDIMAKAKRLIQSGQVQILRNGATDVIGHVVGDHGDYQTEISREDPNSQAITQWQCECPWDQYAFQRTRQWKKYEGRPCAHILATWWKAQSTPLDEDQAGTQQSLFAMPPGASPSPTGPSMGQPAPQPSQQMQIPGMAPQPPGVLPPFPGEQQAVVNPASVPGLRPATPTNPVQMPGTFSSWQFPGGDWNFVAAETGFINGAMVSTKEDDWGIWQGRSEAHGAGEQVKIPRGSPGEVLGVDPTTGMVNVLFMNEAIGVQQMGQMEPWGATAWFWPNQLVQRGDIRPPGPAIRRR